MLPFRRSIVQAAIGALIALQFASAAFGGPRLGAGGWAKYKHDAYNSGRSPATTIATPVFKWVTSLSNDTYKAGPPSLCEPVMDLAGNIYVVDQSAAGCVTKISPKGAFVWRSAAKLGGAYFGTCALWNDGTKGYLLTGAGWGAKSPDASNPTGVYFINLATGATEHFVAAGPSGSDLSPAVGSDGTIYAAYQLTASTGRLIAIDPATKTIKWTYGNPALGEYTVGSARGSAVVTSVRDGQSVKNLIIHGGRTAGNAAGKDDIIAIVDDGDSPRLLWHATVGLHFFSGALSNDGRTVYCLNTSAGTVNNLIALDVLTGARKWGFSAADAHSRTLAIGADGTIYTASDKGKLCAIVDNGTSARLKWSVALPDAGLCGTPAVISSSPAVVYLGTSNGWFYAVRDDGSAGAILWSRWRFLPSGVAAPGPACVAGDGTVYCQYGDSLVAFQPGLTAPEGYTTTVSGQVLDATGAPVDSYVTLSAQNANGLPIVRNSFGYVRTSEKGKYEIQVQGAERGQYYLAAWGRVFSEEAGKSYLASDPVVLAIDTGTRKLTHDLVLKSAGRNMASRSAGATVWCSNEDPSNPAENVIDQDTTSRWVTVDSPTQHPTTAKPTILRVDIGRDVKINQAVLYWEYACADAYKLQCLSSEYKPDVEESWTAHGTTLYTSTSGRPMNCYPETFWGGAWADVLRFRPTSARYWRLIITSGFPARSKLVSMWDMELNAADSDRLEAKDAPPSTTTR